MSAVKLLPLVGLLVVIAACNGRPAGAGAGGDPAAAPLTLDQWKTLPASTKYEIVTLERLKAGDPKLMDQRAWDKFTRDVLLPAKKKDQSAGPK